VDTAGNVLAEHDGYERFTIGQRKGLNYAAGSRRYVLEIIPETRQVVLGDREGLLARGLVASKVNWLADTPPESRHCTTKIRYRHAGSPATVRAVSENGAEVMFDDPQSAITPGQAVVFYDDTRVLGGGWIERAL